MNKNKQEQEAMDDYLTLSAEAFTEDEMVEDKFKNLDPLKKEEVIKTIQDIQELLNKHDNEIWLNVAKILNNKNGFTEVERISHIFK